MKRYRRGLTTAFWCLLLLYVVTHVRVPGPGNLPYRRNMDLRPREITLTAEIWQAGVQKDLSKLGKVVEALDWPHPLVRRTAALALGRMESSKALPALERARQRIPRCTEKQLRPLYPDHAAAMHWDDFCRGAVLRRTSPRDHVREVVPAADIAIARIKSAKHHGALRILYFQRYLGLLPLELCTAANYDAWDRPGQPPVALSAMHRVCFDRMLVDTAAEIVAEEKARGCWVQVGVTGVHFDDAQRMRISLAHLPRDERIGSLIGRIGGYEVLTTRDGDRMARQLAAERPNAGPAIMKRLEADCRDPSRITVGDGLLAQALAASGGKSARPFLKSHWTNKQEDIWHRIGSGLALLDESGRFRQVPFGVE